MKRIACLLCAVLLLLPLFGGFGAAAASLETKEKDGIVYTCVNTKAAYSEMVRRAIESHEEHVNVYYVPEETEWDESFSNDGRNFTHYNTQTQFDDFLDYCADSVCITASPENIYDANGDFAGTTREYWGTIDITYIDTKEELAKADAEIRRVLSGISSKSTVEQLRYVVDYICDKAQAGVQKLPDGGYDRINGAYDVLSGVRTNTVCTSFAVTMMRFLELMGLENVLLSNKESVHVWNMVELDGQWYGIDCTFEDEDPGGYFLMGYDRLKSYDTEQSTPVAIFARNHKVASVMYGTSVPGTTASRPAQSTSKTNKAPTKAPTTRIPAPGQSEPTVSGSTAEPTNTAGSSATAASDEPQRVDITAQAAVEAEVFLQAAQNGQDLSLEGDGYRWLFAGEDLRGVQLDAPFEAAITRGEEVPQAQREQIEQAAGGAEVYPFAFAYHGKLPAQAEVCIRVADQYAGKPVYIYYLDEENRPVQAAVGTVTADALLTFSTDHCSLWFISEQAVAAAADNADNAAGMPVWGWVLIGAGAAVVLAAAGTVAALVILKKRRQAQPAG